MSAAALQPFRLSTMRLRREAETCSWRASVVICILSKAFADGRIKQGYYNSVLKKYSKYDFSHLSPEKRAKEKERTKKNLERERARKEWEMRPHIIYTPMGNGKRRK